jgi:NAD(P)-dependent dehydrogenase (short-subunit alcohol dehydrogenase family)
MNIPSLEGKTVVISGAGSGIGRALALGFLAEGAVVVGCDVSREGLEEIRRKGVATAECDVARQKDWQDLMDFAMRLAGRVDVLFNNAGIDARGPIEDVDARLFEQCLRVHLLGGFLGLKAALPLMRKQGYGRVVNMLSRGMESQVAGWAGYASAKAGLFALTRVASAEVAGLDILVNGMIPGPTRTAMNRAPGLQEPEAVYPGARWLATLPKGGPSGKVFWNREEYRPFGGDPRSSKGPGAT